MPLESSVLHYVVLPSAGVGLQARPSRALRHSAFTIESSQLQTADGRLEKSGAAYSDLIGSMTIPELQTDQPRAAD